jgi:uncharacterized protein
VGAKEGRWTGSAAVAREGDVIGSVHLILFVRDQRASADYYRRVLGVSPRLDVPGMTEFGLGAGVALGLMPEAGIRRLLGPGVPDPATGGRVPRAELYLRVDDPAAYHRRALANGGLEISPLSPRDWGDEAAYSLDPDGHVVAFARSDLPTPAGGLVD